MGVPKFYKWLSERYPLINQIISDTSMLPEVDNFYLDMNGIIHNCSHPNDNAASNKVSERDMMLGIFRYINRCVSEIVKPKKVLFLAIDGVAPRAKMNQQRARRFRAAEERAESIEKARASNEGPINSDELFDSNSITPGTEFMDRVSAHIKYFIRQKVKEDPLWQNLEIIFSGHDVPGEGEHKIMSYIREQRALPNYSANTRHCMYGQDADLIMLGLATHEPHFVLLREVIDFNANRSFSRARNVTIQQTREAQFQLLHLSVLREYIEVDFASGCGHELSIERLIDDFIFLTFLVGNDFLPHLPTLDIGEHAFDVIFTAYRYLIRNKPGYIVENGSISGIKRLESLCQIIGKQESQILEARQEDVIRQATKASRGRGRMNDITLEQYEHEESEKEALYLEAIEEALSRGETPEGLANLNEINNDDGNNVDKNGNTIIKKDFRGRYYFDKFQKVPGSLAGDEFLSNLMKSYLEGLEWCLGYYMKGCVSWTWYFPYHYGPMLQDMKDLTAIFSNISFTLGQPFLPFQQLLGCLPPLSANLLPASYRKLMKDNDSPVIEFYPDNFKVDMNGKKAPWEAVVILPFIDSKRLLDAERVLCSPDKLTEVEKKRNRFGKVMYLQYSPTELSTYYSCNPEIGLPDIHKCQSIVTYRSESISPGVCFKSTLIPGTLKHYPGFPSLACIPMDDAYHASVKMNVFGTESRYKSLIVCTKKFEGLDPTSPLLGKLVGNSVWVNYPQIHEARITAVSTEAGEWVYAEKKSPSRNKEIDLSFFGKSKNHINGNSNENAVRRDEEGDDEDEDDHQIKFIEYDRYQSAVWREGSEQEEKRYRTGRGLPGTGGVEIGHVECRVRVQVLQGMRRDPYTGALTKVFGEAEAEVPLQLVLRAPPVRDIRFEETSSASARELLPAGSVVVACEGKMRGMRGEVVTTNDNNRTATVKFLELPVEPAFGHIISSTVVDDFVGSRDVAKSLGMSPSVLGKLVGSIFVEVGRVTVDMGLNLKRNGVYAMNGYCRMRELDASGNALQTNTVNWSKGDTVTVIGSTGGSNDNTKDADGFWEYTFAAVGLIAEYKAKFPLLFDNLEKYSHLPKYKATALFGAQAGPMSTKVCEWLNAQKVMSLPRTPLTTLCLPSDAVKAIERAADVRVGTINKDIDDQKITEKVIENIPLTALFRGNVFDATDAPLTFNDGLSPTLGDRVINLTSIGVPFALRGTVISIHRNTQYVEVVFDEEFTGGKSLGGQCSPFRGRLVPWAGLLCLSSSQSQKEAKAAQKKAKQQRKETQEKLINVIKTSKATTTPVTSSNTSSEFASLTDSLIQHLKIGQKSSVPAAATLESPEAFVEEVDEEILSNGAGLSALMAAAHSETTIDDDDDNLENDFEASHLLKVQQQIDMQVHMQTQMNFLDFNMPMLSAAQQPLFARPSGNHRGNNNSNNSSNNRSSKRESSNENKNGNTRSRDNDRRDNGNPKRDNDRRDNGKVVRSNAIGNSSRVAEKKSQKERKKERTEQEKKVKIMSAKDKIDSGSGLLMDALGIKCADTPSPPTTTTSSTTTTITSTTKDKKEKVQPIKKILQSGDDKQGTRSSSKTNDNKNASNESMRSALKDRIAALKGKNQKKGKNDDNKVDDSNANVVPPTPPTDNVTSTVSNIKVNDLPNPPKESKKIDINDNKKDEEKKDEEKKDEEKKDEKKIKVSSFIPSNVLRRKKSSTTSNK